ncbi:Na+/H+ antiporter subunit G [Oceanobacter kriegii]|uniref:Na+/H+ antiporter subunit G n=1 Tax=Oceanobacter kriegii TaxID=64972 RepID=UPI0003FFC803|nr:Na+/H+ antiporter subunit G [Oceanobacter kriegii]
MTVLEWVASFLLVLGGLFVLIGAVGMVKLPDVYTRLHAPTKTTTLGIGCILIASMCLHVAEGRGLSIQEMVISLFLFITAPVSAYMIAKASLHRRVSMLKGTANSELAEKVRDRKAPEQPTTDEQRPAEH